MRAWLITGIVLACGACEQEVERPLNAQERKVVSQRYADTVRTLTPIVDSLCYANRSALVAHLADSLYADRVVDLERERKQVVQ